MADFTVVDVVAGLGLLLLSFVGLVALVRWVGAGLEGRRVAAGGPAKPEPAVPGRVQELAEVLARDHDAELEDAEPDPRFGEAAEQLAAPGVPVEHIVTATRSGNVVLSAIVGCACRTRRRARRHHRPAD
ncbi:MAG: hypothetical protein ABR583_14840 [Gaiellaceae bacterium]